MQAGVLSVSAEATSGSSQGPASSQLPKKTRGRFRGKGRKNSSENSSSYVPVPVPKEEEMLKVYTVGLAAADQVLAPEMCKDPLPMLAAVMGVLSLSEESPMLPDSDKGEIRDAISYLGERIATVSALVDPSTPTINMAELLPRGRRGPTRTMMFDVARGLARRVPLTKLVALDGDIRPYLASLMVAALHRANDKLVIPDDLEIEKVTREAFENMLAKQAGATYDNYGTIAGQLLGKGEDPAEAERRQRDRMEQQMG